MRVEIHGYRYDFRMVRRLASPGLCESPRGKKKVPKIRVRKDNQKVELLDTVIHELLHAALWDLSEETVGIIAKDISSILWTLGYRNIKEISDHLECQPCSEELMDLLQREAGVRSQLKRCTHD